MPHFLFGLLLLCLATHLGSAAVISLNPLMDNSLYEDPPTGSLSNGAGAHFFVGVTGRTDQRKRGVLSFDIASVLPSAAVIDSATLTLTLSRSSSGPTSIGVHSLLASWGEAGSDAGDPGGTGASAVTGDATWLHRFFDSSVWASPGGDFTAAASASQTVSGVGSYTFGSSVGLVADVQGWLNSPATNFGWLLKNTDESVLGTAKRFETRETSVISERPLLTITYSVPEPAALALLGFGVVPLLGRRRD